MNTGKVSKLCFAIFVIASLTMPAFAAKTAPVLGKAKTAQSMKLKCFKKSNAISAKQKTVPIVSLKKTK